MVIYRALQPLDIEPVARFAADGLPMPQSAGVRLSMDKVRAVVRHFAGSASDFHLVAFDGSNVVGAIAACVSEMLFFERCEATVVMCQARGEPGIGRELISRLMAWATSDMRVRRVQFPVEIGARRGFERLLRGHGFNQVHRACMFSKG